MLLFEFQNEIGEVVSRRIQPVIQKVNKDSHVLKPGDLAPDFRIQEWINPIDTLPDHITLTQLIKDKPLVLSFLDPDWPFHYLHRFLSFWENISLDLQKLGINLLLLKNNSELYRPGTHDKIATSLNLAKDSGKEIASLYKIYTEGSPIWERVSGIDNDVVSPAFFVINSQRRITYTRQDEGFKLNFTSGEIIKSIF